MVAVGWQEVKLELSPYFAGPLNLRLIRPNLGRRSGCSCVNSSPFPTTIPAMPRSRKPRVQRETKIESKEPRDAEESDDDAPEAVSLSTAKQSAKAQEESVRKVQQSVKEKEKEKRRKKEQALKERAEKNKAVATASGKGSKSKAEDKKGKSKEVEVVADEDGDDEEEDEDEMDEETRKLQERMMKAMDAAEDESDEGEDFGVDEDGDGESDSDDEDEQGYDSETIPGFKGFGDPDAAFDSDEEAELEEEDDSDEERESDEDDDGKNDEQRALDDFERRVNHLPDHLFEAAFSFAPTPPSTKGKFKATEEASHAQSHPSRKRRRSTKDMELNLGSKRVRVLSTMANGVPKAPLAQPSAKVNKFLNRTLALKGKTGKAKLGWERRPGMCTSFTHLLHALRA